MVWNDGLVQFDTRPAAYAVIIRDGEVLLSHWSLKGYTSWTLPGGGIEVGESPAECCRREVFEETGYHVEVGPLIEVGHRWIAPDERITPNGDRALLTIQFIHTAEIISGELVCEVDGTTDDVRWVPLGELDEYARADGWPTAAIERALRYGGDGSASPGGH